MNAKAADVVVPHDPVNEQVILAAAMIDDDACARLMRFVTPDHFLVDQHRVAWTWLAEMRRRKLAYDPATLHKISGGAVDMGYLGTLLEQRPDMPPNLDQHLTWLRWDKQRAAATTGPIAALIAAVRDPKESPDRVKALARAVAGSFDGFEDRTYLRDNEQLIAEQITDIRARFEGRATYRYGLDGLDFAENGIARMVPGPAPGMVTVITGLSGSGKTTCTARIVLGLARLKRKVLYGAWEVKDGMTLELLATMALGLSRTRMMTGDFSPSEREIVIANLAEYMRRIGKYVRFLANPFQRRRNTKASNESNLDLVQGYIEDSACDVFVADLWKRCLVRTDPDDEEHALYRQQAMAEETKTHHILVQQQRLKDVEQRPDKRPTREGIKGTGAWAEVADTIIGVHRPALWKQVDDNTIETPILKQRWGKWPLNVEHDWDPDKGTFENGRTIAYEQPRGEVTEGAGGDRIDTFLGKKKEGGGGRSRRSGG